MRLSNLKNNALKSLLILPVLFMSQLHAQEPQVPSEAIEIPVSPEEKVDASAHGFPIMSEVAGNNLIKQRDDYLRNAQKKMLRLGTDRKGTFIGWGQAAINTSPQSIDFGQKRIMAFEQAFITAKSTFVRMQKQSVATTVMQKFFDDSRENQEVELKDGTFVGIAKKIGALTEAALDKKLAEYGVDPETVTNSDITKKRTLMENSLNKEITVRAVQNISGIRILASFEDEKAIGVLIKASPKYRDMANAIASRKLVSYPAKTDPQNSIMNQLEERLSDKDYFLQHGLRIMTDGSGNRVLVSFGQWSPKVTSADSRTKINNSVKAAKIVAYNQALSYMTQFINTTMALKNKTVLSGSDTITELTRSDKSRTEEENNNVGALVDEFIKETSNLTIEGVNQIHSWDINHPETGHPLVGTVLMWSPTMQEYARAYNRKPTTQRAVGQHSKTEEPKNYKTYRSTDLGDNDF